MKSILDEPKPLSAPTTCPFCRSPRIKTTSENVTSSSYWRCEECGEMWNVGRLQTAARRSDGPRWK